MQIGSPTPPPSPCEVTVDTITGLGDAPYSIAYDLINKRMYVTNINDGTVSVIDTTTNTVIGKSIMVGNFPYDIAYDQVNERMYVTNSNDNTVSVINLCPNAQIQQQQRTNDIITTTNNNDDDTIIKNMIQHKEEQKQNTSAMAMF